MKYNDIILRTQRNDTDSAISPGTRLLIRGGFMEQIASGIWITTPVGLMVRRNVENLVRKGMQTTGAIELELPILQPKTLWDETDRWQKYLKENIAFHLTDRKDNEFMLAPTAEEVITRFAANNLPTYRDLPKIFWQMTPKFRDELRPRQGIIRGREFIMKDAYSFNIDESSMAHSFDLMEKAYQQIFTQCGFDFVQVTADSGTIGGSGSAEFMAISDTGEDVLWCCQNCDYKGNQETFHNLVENATPECPKCKNTNLEEKRGIELGHIFQLQQTYSKLMNAGFMNSDGIKSFYWMGCYGIGISRIAQAIVEQSNDEQGIIWPLSLAPFTGVVIPVNTDKHLDTAINIYTQLQQAGINVLLDDRPKHIGEKLTDAELLGWPFQILIGKNWDQDKKLEVRQRWKKNYDREMFTQKDENSTPLATLTLTELQNYLVKCINNPNNQLC